MTLDTQHRPAALEGVVGQKKLHAVCVEIAKRLCRATTDPTVWPEPYTVCPECRQVVFDPPTLSVMAEYIARIIEGELLRQIEAGAMIGE